MWLPVGDHALNYCHLEYNALSTGEGWSMWLLIFIIEPFPINTRISSRVNCAIKYGLSKEWASTLRP